jgi:hypothetical protein
VIQIRSLYGTPIKEINLDTLRGADLSKADLSFAYLREADLRGADLRKADLDQANLSMADLREADLRGADLSGANLRGADLRGADLRGANLSRASLPPPQMVLLAKWDEVSEELCADLMEYEASSHPDRAAFDAWAAGGNCPYWGVIKVQRSANFKENKFLWGKGKIDTPYSLMVRILREKTKTDL